MKLVCFIAIALSCFLLSGCKENNFFDIQNSMQAPNYSKSEDDFLKVLNRHFSKGFNWSYQYLNDKYCCVSEHEFKSEFTCNLAFCKDDFDVKNVHILFLNRDKNLKWQIFGEITVSEEILDKVYLKDINNDGIDEILILKKGADDFEKYVIKNFNDDSKVEKIEN